MACHVTATLYLPDELIATLRTRVNRIPKGDAVRAFSNELRGCAGGARRGKVRFQVAGVQATQTVACATASAVNNTDTLVIGGTALSVKASPATESEVSKGTTDAEFAANVVAKINAHTTLSKYVFAVVTTSASGILTIYSIAPGLVGNFITLTETGNGFTVGGAVFAGGTSDAIKAYQLGYDTETRLAG